MIPSVSLCNTGEYQVLAKNRFGQDKQKVELDVRAASALDSWQWRLPRPQGRHLKAVAWGGGLYVAVGNDGTILASPDGVVWQNVSAQTTRDLESIAYGNHMFIAAGDGLSFKSSDGLNWSLTEPLNGDSIRRIAFGNGAFLALGSRNLPIVYKSRNGTRWQAIALPSFANEIMYGDGTFVISTLRPDSNLPEFYYSKNGVRWELMRLLHPEFFVVNRPLKAVTHTDTGFAAISESAGLFTSSNGVWTQDLKEDVEFRITSVAAQGGRFVATCEAPAGKILTSDGRSNWTVCETLAAHALESVIFAGGKFIAVGLAGTVALSDDGIQWTPQVANALDYHGVAQGGDQLVVVGDGGTVLTSVNGQHWALQERPVSEDLRDVSYAQGMYVAVGHDGVILTSTNAFHWQEKDSDAASDLNRVSFLHDRWFAVGKDGFVGTSTNGSRWETVWTPDDANYGGIAYGNGIWVLAGGRSPSETNATESTSLLISANAVDWISQPTRAKAQLNDVAFGAGKFVAVGNYGLVAVSSSGTNWQSFSVGSRQLERVIFAEGRFVTVGFDGACYSSTTPDDEESWTHHRAPDGANIHSVARLKDGSNLIVGNNGIVLQSRTP